VIEVILFGFLAEIVDWLTNVGKENFLEQEGNTLIVIGVHLRSLAEIVPG